jgi:cyanophycinase
MTPRAPSLLRRAVGAAGLALLLAAAPAAAGELLLNGGGGETPDFWAKFFELAGGRDAPVVILPTASSRPEAGPEYVEELERDHGATAVQWLPLATAEDAANPEIVAAIAAARGVFFTGGDQSRITAALLGTPAMEALRGVFERGAVLAGSSAGLACMSEVMITGEGNFEVVRAGAVETKLGLGFVTQAVVDQHFIARQRLNRLLSVVLERPALLGIGVDERTAVWIRPDATVRVLGAGSVVVVDARGAALREAPASRDLGARGVALHLYLPGDGFGLATGQPIAAP